MVVSLLLGQVMRSYKPYGHISQHTLFPTSHEYNSLCQKLISKYPKLRDSIGSTGYVSMKGFMEHAQIISVHCMGACVDVVWVHCAWMWCEYIVRGCGLGTLCVDVVWVHCAWMWFGYIVCRCGVSTCGYIVCGCGVGTQLYNLI